MRSGALAVRIGELIGSNVLKESMPRLDFPVDAERVLDHRQRPNYHALSSSGYPTDTWSCGPN